MASQEKIRDAGILTYSNYAHAFCLHPETWEDLEMTQNALTNFQGIQQSARATENLKRHLQRGFMTLRYMDMISVDRMPGAGIAAAFWIPVQAYYAVHGFGLAAFEALPGDPNLDTHAQFINAATSQLVCRFLPDPFVARLKGGFRGCDFMEFSVNDLHGLTLACEPKDWPKHTDTPNKETRISHIARCLCTTRKGQLEAKFDDQSKGGEMPSRDQKIDIANRHRETTIFDYLYRVRLQSNYANPQLFAIRKENEHLASEFVKNNCKMTKRLCRLLLRIIERRLKTTDYTRLVNDCQSGVEWEV